MPLGHRRRKTVRKHQIREMDGWWYYRHPSGYDERYETEVQAKARKAAVMGVLPPMPSFKLKGWDWKAQTGSGRVLYRASRKDQKLSLRFSPLEYDYRTSQYRVASPGIRHPVAFRFFVMDGSRKVGTFQVQLNSKSDHLQAVMTHAFLDDEYQGIRFGSGVYVAAKHLVDHYARERDLPGKFISMREATQVVGSTSDSAQRLWDRLRGQGLLNRILRR